MSELALLSKPVLTRRLALAATAAVAGLFYAWALGQDTLEYYYGAAVRSMSMSWHDFIFGAFDPAGTITLDKLPGAFWLQALSVRAFGFHPWALVLPQVIEGIVTVLVLYRAVTRLAGPAAGLIASLVLAVSPATVALDRGNISDSLMILLLVLAADAVSAAIASEDGRFGRLGGATGRLVLAGVWVGLAFQAKMIEAWMVLPAMGLAYLLAGPGPAARRVGQLVIAGVVAGLVSVSWMTAVSLVPAADRPYVDGSHDDSIFVQVFSYNGFVRFGDQTPLQLLAGTLNAGTAPPTAATGPPTPVTGPPTPATGPPTSTTGPPTPTTAPPTPTTAPSTRATAPDRLLRGDLGRDTGWLIPAAAAVALWGLASRRRRPRGDPLRACFVLWGVWLVTLFAVFSAITTINAYYTAALSPPVAAIIGAGTAAAWSDERTAVSRSVGLELVVAGTAGYAAWLVSSSGARVPSWLVPAIIAVAAAAIGISVWSLLVPRAGVWAGALAAGLVSVALVPAVASASLAASSQGAFDTPFEPARTAQAVEQARHKVAAFSVTPLQSQQDGAPYLMAAETGVVPSLVIYDSGLEALPIGGLTGTIPSPTLGQLQADIRAGRFRLVWIATDTDPRLKWLATHCSQISPRFYSCRPADAG
jgi:4-amino-4-deoxy-L-arabinose transferase-like glycosyltransferase